MAAGGIRAPEQLQAGDLAENAVQPLRRAVGQLRAADRADVERAFGGGVRKRSSGHDYGRLRLGWRQCLLDRQQQTRLLGNIRIRETLCGVEMFLSAGLNGI